MKVHLPNGRLVKIGVRLGEEKPILVRPLPSEARGKSFRSVRINLTVFDSTEKELGSLTGVGYCSPMDQFRRSEGRKRAMKGLYDDNRKKQVLSKDECRLVSHVLLTGRKEEQKDNED